MTQRKKKTLSDNISFLLSSANEKLVNPDEDINTESRARVVDEDALDDDIADTVSAPSKLRRKNDALLDSVDRKYRGGVTSRKALKDSDSEDDGDDDDDEEEESYDDDDEEEIGDSEDDAIAKIRKKGSESFASFTDFNGSDDEGSDDDDDGSNDNHGGSNADDGGSNDEDDDDVGSIDEDNEDVGSIDEDNEESGATNKKFHHFSMKDTNLEVRKGQAVRNQLNLWDSMMECRIQMQKVVAMSNQLPQAKIFPMFCSHGGPNFSSIVTKAENNVTKLLESLLKLQEHLLKQYSETKDLKKTAAKLKEAEDDGMDDEIPSSDDEKDADDSIHDDSISETEVNENSDDEINGVDEDVDETASEGEKSSKLERKQTSEERPHKRRKLNDYGDLLAKHHKDFAPYLNSTIQKWNTKTQVAVGRASSKNFSAFEQSTLQQIEHILADKQRLIRRTQLRRSDYKVLGQIKEQSDKNSSAPDEELVAPDVPPQEDQKNTAESSKEYSPEIFDDADFYHQLLRELIEKKTADVTDPVQLGRQWIQLQKMRSKMKRKVDVKASKGRRLRYAVHPKLVNYMAPQPDLAWSDEAKNELYSSLFGQRKS